MKYRGGQKHTSEAGHTLFGLLRASMHRKGDKSEFIEMLINSRLTIIQICLLYTDRQPDSIRDLYQEIVCTLWEAWPEFRSDSAANTWVRRIALNVAVTQYRGNKRRPVTVPLEKWMYDTIAEEIEESPPDYFRILDSLEPDEQALIFFRLKGLSYLEMADIFNTSESAIKQRLYRLRKHLDILKRQNDY